MVNPCVCLDADECARATDLCDDFCVNTVGSYVCYCLDESQLLLANGITCSSKYIIS